jgi:hypothetical protein
MIDGLGDKAQDSYWEKFKFSDKSKKIKEEKNTLTYFQIIKKILTNPVRILYKI